jgi:hypothetical protein
MQPSTQVTHIPDDGTVESSVLFFVSVAAEAFTFEITISFLSFIASYFISQATHGFM